MKKIIFRFLLSVFFIISMFISYLSIVGIKTNKLNNQIANVIKNYNQDLEIELNEVKIILNPLKFEINAKTVGSKFKIKEKIIEFESIKTQISINSLINNDFSLKNLEISTRSLKIENLIAFARNVKNSPELYLLGKVLKKGYLISDINLEFDNQGKIKKNYKIKGFVQDAQITLLKKYDLNKINLIFNLAHNTTELKNINLLLNNTPLLSEKIIVKNLNNNFLIEGLVENKNTSLENQIINNFINVYLSKLDLSNLNFNSKNKFSFNVSKKFKIDNFNLSSEIKLNNLKMANNSKLNFFFPNVKKKISLNDHIININYNKKKLIIKGSGNILFQEKEDEVTYSIIKKNKALNFEVDLNIDKNPLIIDFLGYKKKPNVKAHISLKGTHFFDKKTTIQYFSLDENKNKIILEHLVLDKSFRVKSFKKINLDYFDEDLRENKISILNKDNAYSLTGAKYNANSLIENLTNEDSSNDIKILNLNFDLNVKIDQVYLDKEYIVNNLSGNLSFKKNEVSNAELNALFSKNKKFKFTVKTNKFEKVTTLFLGEAEPAVKRYKFIKGFKGGSLDFYSSKKGDKSLSNLKIYNFKLKELPALTKILTLASLQGIADILSGEGITFDEFEMNFDNQNNLMTINEIYAIGPAISILMDGYIEKDKLVSLRGSLVPATTINKAIGNIPILGKILVGSKTGEGVFGVSFKIKGPPKKIETSVNPIKTLTPRFITRTLEKIKKN